MCRYPFSNSNITLHTNPNPLMVIPHFISIKEYDHQSYHTFGNRCVPKVANVDNESKNEYEAEHHFIKEEQVIVRCVFSCYCGHEIITERFVLSVERFGIVSEIGAKWEGAKSHWCFDIC
jgi:hypothetical protein